MGNVALTLPTPGGDSGSWGDKLNADLAAIHGDYLSQTDGVFWQEDTAAQFASDNPILRPGEIGRETDTGMVKVGDGATGWTGLGYQPRGLVDFATIPGGRPSLAADPLDCAPAFAAAMSTLKAGQALLLRFDPHCVDASGYCNYYIASPIEITAEIPIVAESRRVAVTLIPSANWGSTYCHAVRNWRHTDYAGAVPTEVVGQAPDHTADYVSVVNLGSLDGNGLMVRLNGANGVSAVSLVHPHELSKVRVTAETGSSAGAPFQWGNRTLSIFANNDSGGVCAGPLRVEFDAYGQGWDHHLYVDGTNGGTTANWVQDLRVTDSWTAPVYNSAVTFKNCIKSPLRVTACNRLTVERVHVEALPATAPPTAGAGAWQASTAVAAGTRLLAATSAGANAGLAMMYVCTTAGTTGAAQPAFPSTGTVVDGTAVWTAQSFSSANAGNSSGGVLDGATGWPGATVTVPLGTTISPDGAHGWVCTTAGTTGAAQPAFDTAAGRGATQADGTVTWTYFCDSFDSAVIRVTDTARVTLSNCRVSAFAAGSNRPLWRSTVTGTAPAVYALFALPDVSSLDIELSGVSATGLMGVDKGGWWATVVDDPAKTLAWSTATFDPRHISRLSPYAMEFLHGATLTPTHNIN